MASGSTVGPAFARSESEISAQAKGRRGSPKAREAFRRALESYYWEREGRGRQCRIDWYLRASHHYFLPTRHFIVGGQLVVKSALADPGRNGLDLCGGEMATLWHGAHAAVRSRQGLRHQAERRVEGLDEKSPVATRLGWLIHDGSIIPRRVAHLA
jgi:hypothetical protein